MRRVAVLAVALVVVRDCRRAAHPWSGTTAHRRRRRPLVAHRPSRATESAAPSSVRPDVEPARRAAIRAVAMTGEVVRAGFISRRELIESFTTPSFGPTLAGVDVGGGDGDAARAGRARRRRVDAGGGRAADHGHRRGDIRPGCEFGCGRCWWSPRRASGRAGRCGAPSPSTWSSVGGRWLVDGWTSTPGPSPAPPAEGAFDDAAAFVEPLGWPPHRRAGDGRGGLSDVAVPEPARPVR